MSGLLVTPIAVPLACAAAALLFRRRIRTQRALGVVGAILQFASAVLILAAVRERGILVLQLGGWAAPFGITLVADHAAALLLLLPGIVGVVVTFEGTRTVGTRRLAFGFHPFVLVLLAGVSGAFLAGDIFNLYVSFEVMLMASFVLMALGNERAQMEGATKYVTLNLLSSAVFLAAVGILYATAGTLNLAELARRARAAPGALDATLALLFFAAFGIKAAVFPFFFWLPASYHTPPAPVSTLFAGLLTKVGVYALVRTTCLLFPAGDVLPRLLPAVAIATMVAGVLGALAQNEFRRVLAFHSVSQVGYMLLGLALFTPLALAGSLLFLLHHALAKGTLFLVGGWVERWCGTGALARTGGLARARPFAAGIFFLAALGLAGIPPLSGFLCKYMLVRAAFEERAYVLGGVALGVGVLTLLSMLKLWNEAFWKPAPGARPRTGGTGYAPALLMVVLIVAMGCAPDRLIEFARTAADQLLDPAPYVAAVLGGDR